jgi:hypothetical protein
VDGLLREPGHVSIRLVIGRLGLLGLGQRHPLVSHPWWDRIRRTDLPTAELKSNLAYISLFATYSILITSSITFLSPNMSVTIEKNEAQNTAPADRNPSVMDSPAESTGEKDSPPLDGGISAWLVVLGAWCTSFCSFGWINSESS